MHGWRRRRGANTWPFNSISPANALIRSACRSHQCPRFESFQPLLFLLLDTELTAIMTVRNPLLLHNRFILQLISARICARYTYVYICLQSLLMYPRNICVRFSSRVGGRAHDVFILFAIPFESGRIYVQVLPGF